MNAMVWVRGSRHDFDDWQLDGWSWDDVEPVYRRMEAGPMRITRPAQADETTRRFVAAARGIGIPDRDDISGPHLHGAAFSPITVWRGQRWSTARGYLDAARRRRNLSVMTSTLVNRVVVANGRACAVEFERNGQAGRISVKREIIICAGAFGTPAILQRSGIGPDDHLRVIGVETVVDSPRVGSGLADHSCSFMNWELAPGFVGLSDAQHPKWLLRWLLRRSGKLASNFMEAVAHVKSTPDLNDPDFQLIFGPAFIWDYGRSTHPRPAVAILQSYWTPKSRGSVLIQSPDPRQSPSIRMNSLACQDDVAAFIRAVRISREIAATSPLSEALGVELHPGTHVESDHQIEQWLRETSGTTGHPACTAAMGSEPDAVLDERLRVRGVRGLRVADASALPTPPHANTNAPSILFGERCADFLIEDAGHPT